MSLLSNLSGCSRESPAAHVRSGELLLDDGRLQALDQLLQVALRLRQLLRLRFGFLLLALHLRQELLRLLLHLLRGTRTMVLGIVPRQSHLAMKPAVMYCFISTPEH